MYITRNKFPIISENENGELIGVAIQGVKVLPMNIEVGDFLTPFQDIAMSAKTTEHFTVEEEFLSDIKTTTNIRHGHFTDSYDGQYKYGTYQVTQTEYIYETIDVNVKKEAQFFIFTIHYAYAYVSGKEEMVFNGKTYDAYIINSESWGKGMNQIEYESSSADVIKNLEKMDNKVERMLEKFSFKAGMTNEEGYLVSPSREWYIPGIGMVKTETYDMFGHPQSVTISKGVGE